MPTLYQTLGSSPSTNLSVKNISYILDLASNSRWNINTAFFPVQSRECYRRTLVLPLSPIGWSVTFWLSCSWHYYNTYLLQVEMAPHGNSLLFAAIIKKIPPHRWSNVAAYWQNRPSLSLHLFDKPATYLIESMVQKYNVWLACSWTLPHQDIARMWVTMHKAIHKDHFTVYLSQVARDLRREKEMQGPNKQQYQGA